MTINAQQFGRHVATGLTAGLMVAGATAMAIPSYTHEAPKDPGWQGFQSQIDATAAKRGVDDKPYAPKWTNQLSKQFDGYQAEASRPKGVIPSGVVVQHQDASFSRMSLDQAFDRSGDKNKANDVWVAGYKG